MNKHRGSEKLFSCACVMECDACASKVVELAEQILCIIIVFLLLEEDVCVCVCVLFHSFVRRYDVYSRGVWYRSSVLPTYYVERVLLPLLFVGCIFYNERKEVAPFFVVTT